MPQHQLLRNSFAMRPAHALLVWIMTSLLIYPFYIACSLALDTLLGQRWFLSAYLFDSRSALLRTLVYDGLHALPWAALLGLLCLGALLFHRAPRFAALLLAVVVGALGAMLVNLWTGVALGFALGLAMAFACASTAIVTALCTGRAKSC